MTKDTAISLRPTLIVWLVCLNGLLLGSNARSQGVTFTTNNYTVGVQPVSVAAADLNGDGWLDLICANKAAETVTVLTNNRSGGFALSTTITNAYHYWNNCVVAADINGDGWPDLVINLDPNGLAVIYTNRTNGTFAWTGRPVAAGEFNENLVVADFNGDYQLDLATASAQGGFSGGADVEILTNSPGGLALAARVDVAQQYPLVSAVDLNGNGRIDLISADNGSDTLMILTNGGGGRFGLNATLTVGPAPFPPVAIDLNGDGKPDLVCANSGTNTLTVLTNNGSGVFGSNATLTVDSQPNWVVAADLNGDGYPDLVSANFGTNTLTVLTNDGSGNFGFSSTLTVGSYPTCIVVADVNGDGKPDLIAVEENALNSTTPGTLTVLLNTTPFPPPINSPTLAVRSLGKALRVSWPSSSPGWMLQENFNLGQSAWRPAGYLGYPITDDGTNKSLTQPFFGRAAFYRLVHSHP